MIKQHLRQAWTMMKQHKFFTGVYLIGTAVSITLAMTLFIIFYIKLGNIYPEENRDRMVVISDIYHEKEENGGHFSGNTSASLNMIEQIKSDAKHIDNLAYCLRRSLHTHTEVNVDGKYFGNYETPAFINSGFWKVFNYRFLSGRAFTEKEGHENVVVLSRSYAMKLFADTAIVGRTISLKNSFKKIKAKIMGTFKKTRIVYMGTPEFAVAPLDELIKNGYNIVGVVTVADKASGRGLKVNESAVKKYAVEHNIPVLQPLSLKDPEFLDALRAWKADLFVVVAFRMLPKVVWEMPKLGTFNLHAALLPQYRGAAPINWAVINGDKVSGITTFMLKHEIDTGDVIERREVEITDEDTAGTLHDKLMEVGRDAVLSTVEKIASGDYEAIPQENLTEGELRPAPKIFKEDCRIDWTNDGEKIALLIRGLSPYPAAWTPLFDAEGGECGSIKIFKAQFVAGGNLAVGEIKADTRTLEIGCADGRLSILELQMAGKRRMGVEDFLRGVRDMERYCAEQK